MKLVIAAAVSVVAATCAAGATPAACELKKGLYEQRAAIAGPATGTRPDTNPRDLALAEIGPLDEIDQVYYTFFTALKDAVESQDPTAIRSCCDAAAADRVGSLSCELVSYVATGRTGSAPFVSAVPASRREAGALWDMNELATGAERRGNAVPTAFTPSGPAQRYVTELFMLVLDGNQDAIPKYFRLAALAPDPFVPLFQDQIKMLLRDSPSVVVSNWFLLRKHKDAIKPAAQTLKQSLTPVEREKLVRGVRSFCPSAQDPDCDEITRLLK